MCIVSCLQDRSHLKSQIEMCLTIRLDDVQARLKETHNEFESLRKRARKAKMDFEATKKQRFSFTLYSLCICTVITMCPFISLVPFLLVFLST